MNEPRFDKGDNVFNIETGEIGEILKVHENGCGTDANPRHCYSVSVLKCESIITRVFIEGDNLKLI